MDTQSFFDIIEAYILGQLSPAEQAAFEQAMESDPALVKEVALRRAMQKTLLEEEVRDFRASMKQTIAEERPMRRLVFWAVRIAASLLIVIAAIWWFQNRQGAVSPTQLANTYITRYDPGITVLKKITRSEDDTLQHELYERLTPEWNALKTRYASANYSAAQDQLERLRSMDPEFAVIPQQGWNYYTGMCQLHLGDPAAALETLDQVTFPFKEKATFFRAIALIQLSRLEEASVVLDSIVAVDSHPFHMPAAQLLETM